jgi:putative spermidine/putrescine transport system ATP-binding protein
MSQGRMEQVGTPSQIYNVPATEFVARFVGTLNILSGRVIDARSGRVLVAGRELRTASPVSAPNGTEVSVALRPEAIRIGTAADGGADGNDRLEGTVADVTFLGSIVRVRVRLDDGSGPVAFDTFNNPHALPAAVDSRVTLVFPPEALLVLGSGSTPAEALVDADGLPAT